MAAPPLTPGQELGFYGKERGEGERRLAHAIYFEARNELVRAQIAVAQVVLNRAFSPAMIRDSSSLVCGGGA